MLKLHLAPLGFEDRKLSDRLSLSLERILGAEVNYVDLDIPIEEYRSVERKQYFSTKIIADAIKRTDTIEGKVQMLIEHDLYVPVFTFVFGEAQLGGKHSIVSLCRLHEEFYSGNTNEELLFIRLIKESLHELGHNFGLKHCHDWDCVMHSSAAIEEVDIKGTFYCKTCGAIVEEQTGSRIVRKV